MPRHSPYALFRLNYLSNIAVSRSLELLEFLEHFLFGLLIHCEKVLSFCALNRFPPFGEIVLLPKLERPIILTC